nr:MAG TPA: hypothetical protein [Caudoviricetes sp.]
MLIFNWIYMCLKVNIQSQNQTEDTQMTKKELNALTKIAKKTIVPMKSRTDLERHFNGDEDFLEIAIWELKDALIEAYKLGRK